jgi:hypothetical protein
VQFFTAKHASARPPCLSIAAVVVGGGAGAGAGATCGLRRGGRGSGGRRGCGGRGGRGGSCEKAASLLVLFLPIAFLVLLCAVECAEDSVENY